MPEPEKRDHLRRVAQATLEAERGVVSCRICPTKDAMVNMLVVAYGGSIIWATCIPCAEKGNEILIRRGPGGIEVLRARDGHSLALGRPGMGPVIKRPA